MAEDEDWLLTFLRTFAAMSSEERDAAIDALSPEGRHALLLLADARAATAESDLMEVLDAGHGGLDRLYEVGEPADLLAVINLAVSERPNLVVAALFAAVVAHRGWAKTEQAAIVALREQWIWHVYEQVAALHEHPAEDEHTT